MGRGRIMEHDALEWLCCESGPSAVDATDPMPWSGDGPKRQGESFFSAQRPGCDPSTHTLARSLRPVASGRGFG